MKQEPKAWLPPNAMSDGALCVLLTDRAAAWSRRWFGGADSLTVRMHEGVEKPRIPLGAALWESSCQKLRLAIDQPRELRIAAAMLGLKQLGSKLAGPDLKLLRGLASECLTDLLRNAAEVFGVSQEVRRADDCLASETTFGLRYSISLPAGRSLDLYVERDAAIAARKVLAPQPPRTPTPLGRREEAIDRQVVRVGAYAGSGGVSLGELASLALGDVLLLDSVFGERLGLTVNGVVQAGADCELYREGSAFRLRVTHIEGGVAS